MNAEVATRLPASDKFTFACHRDLSCFTACCTALNLVLTPYDVIRLKKRLGLSSEAFLKAHTTSFVDKACAIPVVRLKMKNDEKQRCPFVSPEGCKVYADRPGACRIYPLGRAASKIRGKKKSSEYYFIIKEPRCRGFNENKQWSIQAWVKDQGLDVYNAMNEFYMDIITDKNFRRFRTLSPQQLQMFYMSCYSLDEFRNFVLKSTFLKRFEIDQDLINKIKSDDIELMAFACRWLRFALFGEKTIREKAIR